MEGIVWIDMAKLVASPWATVGSGKWRRVLKGWIERTGRYEPLVVRPCGGGRLEGCYEIIHGHGRWRVLRELGHERVACVVWDVTELEAMLYMATLNMVRGREVTRKRVDLLRAIARHPREGAPHEGAPHSNAGLTREYGSARREPPKGGTTNDVFAWMGQQLGQRPEVLRRVLAGDGPAAAAPAVGEMKEAFTVFLLPGEKKRVVNALRQLDADTAQALLKTLATDH